MEQSHISHARTVLFLCKCGGNISNNVDFDELVAWAKRAHGADAVAVSNLLCAPRGKQFFQKVLDRYPHCEHIVVAACSPKMHEKTFQDLAEAKGLNLGRVQMANIREHCAWVTTDSKQATEKARALIRAALQRSRFSGDLEQRSVAANTDVLVIGGGLAGIQAARTLARAGRKVYLVEKDISIGGTIIRTEEVAPSMECAPCLLAPLISEVRDDPNIEVIANAEVQEILGFFGNFSARILKRARSVRDNCIGCEECFQVCPVSVPSEFQLGLGERKAIHTLFPGSLPAAAAIDREHCLHFQGQECAACVEVCPFQSINFEDEDQEIRIPVGAVLLACGARVPDLAAFPRLGYGTLPQVYSLAEFERLAASNGPGGGTVQLRDGSQPRDVAVIHCAGSLHGGGLDYCSRFCCSTALKVGELLRKNDPQCLTYHVHDRLVLDGAKEEDFFRDQQQAGSCFLHCSDLDTVQVEAIPDSKRIRVRGRGFTAVEVDMVILAHGLQPAADLQQLAEILHIEQAAGGFLRRDHGILRSVGTALDGVFAVGNAAGPCTAAQATTQAQAAAGEILSMLVPGREIELETLTAHIDETRCAGCKLCIAVCPYQAISFDRERSISVINEAICRGCGTCAAACPIGAAEARHYSDAEIYAEIEGVLLETL